jgi:hypothetical protein
VRELTRYQKFRSPKPYELYIRFAFCSLGCTLLSGTDETVRVEPMSYLRILGDADARAKREAIAQRVIAEFDVPERFVFFLDDKDSSQIKNEIGKANRGFYAPIKFPGAWHQWPDFLQRVIVQTDRLTGQETILTDHIIYLHGSTCESEIGLAMCLAHELQHFHQRKAALSVWAASSIVSNWLVSGTNPLDFTWSDLPTEHEARIVGKRIAEKLYGEESVAEFIAEAIKNAVDEADEKDWRFVESIDCSLPFDLADETKKLYPRLSGFRAEIERIYRRVAGDPDFSGVDLDDLFGTRKRAMS